MVGKPGFLVGTALRNHGTGSPLRRQRGFAFAEALRSPNDRAVRVTDGNRPHQHRNAVSAAMTQVYRYFARLTVAHHLDEWTGVDTQHFVVVVAVHQNVVATKTAEHVMAQVSGDFLGPIVPEHDAALAVYQVDAGVQALQHRAIDFRITEVGHRNSSLCLSAGGEETLTTGI